MSRTQGTPWLRYGCFGCLGLLAFLLLAGGGIVGLAWYQASRTEMSETVATPDLPPVGVDWMPGARTEPETGKKPAGAEGAKKPEEADSRRPASGDSAQDPKDPPAVPAAVRPAGRIRLDLAQARFQIVPGRPGEPLHVEAKYDKSTYDLEEGLEQTDGTGDPDAPSWTYTVGFRRTRGTGFMAALREMIGGTRPTVKIVLPPDTPLVLEANLQQGETNMDVGGLWLRNADIRFAQGGFELRVPEPLKEPMESLTVNGSMGGGMLSDLGNASPRHFKMDFSMGGLVVDLSGPWATDADIDITSSMGGTVVRLPRNVIMEGVPVQGLQPDPTAEIQPPTLRFKTSSSMGEIEFQR